MSTTLSVVTQALVDLLRDKWQDLQLNGPDDVFYGDQAMLPHHPAITVEGTSLSRPLTGTGMVTTETISVVIMIYHSSVKSSTVTKKEIDEYKDLVVNVLHSNKKVGGVIHGHVSEEESGVAERSGTLLRGYRLRWEGMSRGQIWS